MSQADFHRESSNTDGVGPSPPLPHQIAPVVPPPSSVPPPPPPAVSETPPPSSPPPAVVAERPEPSRPAVIPPPPPPRSTLPPVRVAADPRVADGVGSAKGLRWRGELDGVAGPESPAASATAQADLGFADSATGEPESRPTDHVTRTAPPWLISMVIHLVLLLILALIATPVGESIGSVMLSIGQSEKAPVELSEFTIADNQVEIDTETLVDSEVQVDLPSVFESVELPDASEMAPLNLGEGPELADLARPMFSGRTGAMKQALLAIYGGTAQTQEAVKRGLRWLKRNQKKNGSWSMQGPYRDGAHSENAPAATAMALLAFLGDGHTHKGGEYTKEVEKAMRFLIGLQDRSGFFAQTARDHERMYAQAQATIAICELYGMTKDSWLRPRAQLAIDFAQKSQSRQGGWRYQPNQDSDTSVTGWFVMALESGRSAGLEVNMAGLHQVDYFLDSVAVYDGAAYSYQPRGAPTPPMTAEGLLCRQYLGWPRDYRTLVRGIDALLDNSPFDIGDHDVYYWYYATQVMHHYGGTPWRLWNEAMRVQLPAAQVRGGREDGSWAPQMDEYGSYYGRIYTTCLSLYCLEVYYRHMPLYQADGKQKTIHR